LPKFAAQIEYDGAAYHGFQRQAEGQPTIQGELEQTLAKVTQKSITITGAGRTDSGVHALGQVISFTTDWQHETGALQRALNVNLPEDIVILQLKQVASSFHPRFDARRRAYHYKIHNAECRSPLQRRTSWHVRQPLNVDDMNQAAQTLVGTHDFATFGQPPQGNNTVRELFATKWQKQSHELTFDIEANAFLYRMVRSLVGSLKLVGDGSWTVDDFVAAFHACDRDRAGMTAPPQGLYLISVTYDGE